MPDSYWRGPLAYLALALLCISVTAWVSWSVSSDLTEQQVRGEKTAEYHDTYAEEAIDQKCLGLKLPALRDCIHEQIESAHDHERAEQDLDAQQDMARFTKVMGWTAIVSVFLGAGSIVLIFLTLRETQKMAKETTRIGDAQVKISNAAVKSAQEANKITREAMQSANRPFVIVATRFVNEGDWRNGQSSGEWQVELRNYGKSTALIKRAKGGAWIDRSPDSESKFLSNIVFPGFAGGIYETNLLPGDVMGKAIWIPRLGSPECAEGDPNNPFVRNFREEKIFGWLEVAVDYEDLYGIPHETRALFRIENRLGQILEFGGKERNYRT